MLHGQSSWKLAFEIVNHDLSTNYYSIDGKKADLNLHVLLLKLKF